MTENDIIRSTADHIQKVGTYLVYFASKLGLRAVSHDRSKWSEEEWPLFRDTTKELSGLTYGSPEYQESLDKLAPALTHHYAKNRHHPEHWKNGISDMTLVDLLEMICDWKAATERHKDGDILRSLEHNKERFGIDEQLYQILKNTVIQYLQYGITKKKGLVDSNG